MTKLLILDKDGTLVNPRKDKFVQTPWDQVPIPTALATVERYHSEGWKIVVASNQGGIAAGHKSLHDTFLEMRFCLELFPAIEEIFFCPDFEGAECWKLWDDCSEEHRILYEPESYQVKELSLQNQFRKPNAGMLQLAILLHGADEALYVGDRDEDFQAAQAANIPFAWAKDFN